MRYLLAIWLVLMGGCKATEPASSSSTVAKSTEKRQDSTVYIERLRVDTVKLKGDSIRVKVPVPCDTLKPVTGSAKSGRVQLHYTIKSGQLEIDCHNDSLLLELIGRDIAIYRLEKQLDSASQQQQEVVTVTQEVTVYRTPFWNWIVMLAMLCYMLRRQLLPIVKTIAKIPLPWK